MKNYLVSLFIMIVFVIVGAGVANACVVEKVLFKRREGIKKALKSIRAF